MIENREFYIKTEISKGKTLKEIGFVLGVSKQRIYQLLTKYNITPPERKRHNYWKNQSIQHQWLWRILSTKTLSRDLKWMLFNELKNIPLICPILGIPLDFSEKQECVRYDSSPSIDCIDSNKGYISGNVQIISWRANRLKSDGTPEEHLKIGNYHLKT